MNKHRADVEIDRKCDAGEAKSSNECNEAKRASAYRLDDAPYAR
jgi:hypothetical protein